MADWTKGDVMWRLDLAQLRWSEVELNKPSPVPEKRYNHIATVYGNRMFIFGGNRGGQVIQEVWAFNFDEKRWHGIESVGAPGPRKW